MFGGPLLRRGRTDRSLSSAEFLLLTSGLVVGVSLLLLESSLSYSMFMFVVASSEAKLGSRNK